VRLATVAKHLGHEGQACESSRSIKRREDLLLGSDLHEIAGTP
jgi:hypothetical protein